MLEAGYYPDLRVGDVVEFALELTTKSVRTVAADTPASCVRLRDCTYRTTGSLTRPREIAVLDVGVLAFTQFIIAGGPGTGRTAWVEADVRLSVDPFLYTDQHALDEQNPALIYRWAIESIGIETGPMITVRPGDPLYGGPDEGAQRVRDPERRAWTPLERTDSLADGERFGFQSYLLGCRLVDPVPRRARQLR